MTQPNTTAATPIDHAPNQAASLAQPLYGAGFGTSIKRFFKKYATFSGRASRSEYWWVALFNFLVYIVLTAVMIAGAVATMDPTTGEPGGGILTGTLLYCLFGLAVIIPSIALGIRRLHDANFSGWFILLNLVPFFGQVAVIVMMLLPANPQGARFDDGYQPGAQYGGYPAS